MKYTMDCPLIRYMGRIDTSDPLKPVFYFPYSNFKIRFKGTGVSLSLINNTVWGNVSIGYVIDGRSGKLPLNQWDNDKEITLQAADNLEECKEHTLTIYKAMAANHSVCFTGIEITDGELLENNHSYDLKMEVYGDSVSAGEVCEAVSFTGRCDPCSHGSIYDNALYSYAVQTANILNAEIHNIAQGGISVKSGSGYFHAPDYIGMDKVYDSLAYFPEAIRHPSTPEKWDFSKYIPDVVVCALGQNDKHNGVKNTDDVDINDPAVRLDWKNEYKKIVRHLSGAYGKNVKFIFTTTLLMHDRAWDDAIGETVTELCEEGIKAYHFMFKRGGKATPGHPRIPEHNEMTAELTEFIRKITEND